MANKRKRPATPRQGATDQRGHLVVWLKRHIHECKAAIASKEKIPGMRAAMDVVEVGGKLAAFTKALEFASTMDDRARLVNGGL